MGAIVAKLCSEVRPGMTTQQIDTRARELISSVGAEASFLNYRPHGVKTPYPAAVCVSVNDEVVHGIPSENVVIKEGDVVTIDCGLKYKGFYTDHAVTVMVGKVPEPVRKLVETCKQSLEIGINECVVGNTNLDPGIAIEKFIAGRYGIVRDLSGHGVGYAVHEDPYIPNYKMKGTQVRLRPGMVLAVEPMLNIGSGDVYFLDDEYTVVTQSGNVSAHFEHTIIITESGPEIVTLSDKFVL